MATFSLSTFLDRFQPEFVLVKRSLEDKVRARVLIGLYFSCILITLVATGVFAMAHLFWERDFSVALIAVPSVTVFLVVQVLIFYKLESVDASAMVFSMTAFCSILAATVLTGGWDSPVRLLFLCCPVMSFLVGGKQEGIYVGALTMLCGLGLFYLDRIGWNVFHIHRPENIEAIEFSIWIISMTLLISCVVVYDELFSSLSKKVSARI